jgi:hypothetical protein
MKIIKVNTEKTFHTKKREREREVSRNLLAWMNAIVWPAPLGTAGAISESV